MVLRTKEGVCWQKAVVRLLDNWRISNTPFLWLPKIGHIEVFILYIMMMSVLLLRTCHHEKVTAAQARMKLHSAQNILLMHVEILQSEAHLSFFS